MDDRQDETDERGAHADRPSDIPGRGWRDVLLRVGRLLIADHVGLVAAGVAFCAMFAAIPGAAVPVALYGLIADPVALHGPIERLHGLLPNEVSRFLADQMQEIAAASKFRLGAGLGGAILAALWGAWSGASALIAALNMAYREHESRSFARRQLVALVVATATGLFGLLAFALVAVLPVALSVLPRDTAPWTMISLARWPALTVLTIVALGMLYRFAPCRRAAQWRWVSPGAAGATALWLAGSMGFSYYVANLGSYNGTFGVLGTVMLMLTWFYLSAFAVLFGAELNAELERQTARDTTEGPARPAGHRGAAVADTVAPPG